MAVVNDTIYIKGDANVEVTRPYATLGDLVQMECSNPVVVPKLKTIKVLKFSETSDRKSVV